MAAERPPSADEMRRRALENPGEVTQWEIAFHEAGHVIVGVAHGTYPDRVFMNDDPASNADLGGRTEWRSWFLAAVWPGTLAPADERRTAAVEREAQACAEVAMAGDLARDMAVGIERDRYDLASIHR